MGQGEVSTIERLNDCMADKSLFVSIASVLAKVGKAISVLGKGAQVGGQARTILLVVIVLLQELYTQCIVLKHQASVPDEVAAQGIPLS